MRHQHNAARSREVGATVVWQFLLKFPVETFLEGGFHISSTAQGFGGGRKSHLIMRAAPGTIFALASSERTMATSSSAEALVDQHARDLAEARDAIAHLERRVDSRFQVVDRRFEYVDKRVRILDETLFKSLCAVVFGLQFVTLILVFVALVLRRS